MTYQMALSFRRELYLEIFSKCYLPCLSSTKQDVSHCTSPSEASFYSRVLNVCNFVTTDTVFFLTYL